MNHCLFIYYRFFIFIYNTNSKNSTQSAVQVWSAATVESHVGCQPTSRQIWTSGGPKTVLLKVMDLYDIGKKGNRPKTALLKVIDLYDTEIKGNRPVVYFALTYIKPSTSINVLQILRV